MTKAHLRGIGIPLGPALQIMDALKGSRPTQSGSPLASSEWPPSVGFQFATSDDQRQITVLYCDLVQSTKLTHQLGNERYATFFAEYLSTCTQVVAQFRSGNFAADGRWHWYLFRPQDRGRMMPIRQCERQSS